MYPVNGASSKYLCFPVCTLDYFGRMFIIIKFNNKFKSLFLYWLWESLIGLPNLADIPLGGHFMNEYYSCKQATENKFVCSSINPSFAISMIVLPKIMNWQNIRNWLCNEIISIYLQSVMSTFSLSSKLTTRRNATEPKTKTAAMTT